VIWGRDLLAKKNKDDQNHDDPRRLGYWIRKGGGYGGIVAAILVMYGDYTDRGHQLERLDGDIGAMQNTIEKHAERIREIDSREQQDRFVIETLRAAIAEMRRSINERDR